MPNLYKQFMDLQSPKPLLVGSVAFVISSVASVELPGGGRLQARGPTQVGQRVFVSDGAIKGGGSEPHLCRGGDVEANPREEMIAKNKSGLRGHFYLSG